MTIEHITRPALVQDMERLMANEHMPHVGTNRVKIAVCPIPDLLIMKGHALMGCYKQTDAYDIYYCVRNNFEAGPTGRPASGNCGGDKGTWSG